MLVNIVNYFVRKKVLLTLLTYFSRTQVVCHVIYIFFGPSLGKV